MQPIGPASSALAANNIQRTEFPHLAENGGIQPCRRICLMPLDSTLPTRWLDKKRALFRSKKHTICIIAKSTHEEEMLQVKVVRLPLGSGIIMSKVRRNYLSKG
jgi:hypothetical protein